MCEQELFNGVLSRMRFCCRVWACKRWKRFTSGSHPAPPDRAL